jgi:hypothetical protein
MALFSAEQIERFQQDYPKRNVLAILAEIERRALRKPVRSPVGLARTILEEAEREDTHRLVDGLHRPPRSPARSQPMVHGPRAGMVIRP